MISTRTKLAAALCCMAFASGTALAAGDTNSPTNPTTGNSSSSMDRSGMGASGHHAANFDQQTVRQVQQALSDKGHSPGPIDGMMGPRTRSALQDYQRSQNITAGGLDSRTLESLGVQANAAGRGSMGNDAGSSAGGTSGSYGGAGGTTGGSMGSGNMNNKTTPGGSMGSGSTNNSTTPGGSSSSPSGTGTTR